MKKILSLATFIALSTVNAAETICSVYYPNSSVEELLEKHCITPKLCSYTLKNSIHLAEFDIYQVSASVTDDGSKASLYINTGRITLSGEDVLRYKVDFGTYYMPKIQSFELKCYTSGKN